MVTRGSSSSLRKTNKFVKAACLLGLRVSPSHRRLGIATELVRRAEEWCAARGAAYATMATTASNAASLALFQGRFEYALFRKPRFLGHPVHRHRARVPRAHRDVWCIKKLTSVAANGNAAPAAGDDDDWTTAPPSSVLFVDPREF
uniref:N-acetyltransferase domain-containing protein n=1 Tax=Oryza glumipatula TaxID=40148 RepID=A0A0D9YNA4_9ORYZ